MPTVIVLDTSMSMLRQASVQEPSDESLRLKLAIQGINTLLDHLSTHSKLEFVSLVAFSSTYEITSPFTRDFDSLRSKLAQLDVHDSTDTDTVMHAVDKLVLAEWGSTPCQVILVSDGQSDSFWNPKSLFRNDCLPFSGFNFPCKLNIMCIASTHEPSLQRGLPQCHRLVEMAGPDSAVHIPAGDLNELNVRTLFQKLAETNYSSFQGTLKCGNLGSRVVLSPTPRPYIRVSEFDTVSMNISDTIEVCGFMDVADVGSPAAISRHLILPHFLGDTVQEDIRVDVEVDVEEESVGDGGKTPSFCVLLHGALKVENMAAICRLDEDWFGVVYSWADSKKKSNLMLTILEPGSNAVPWLGELNMLGAKDDATSNPNEVAPSFPVRPIGKKSYSQNCLVWIRSSGIQADLQKILRHARKLPDKTHQFYKELNRVRKAALSLGFEELLDGMASIFERECALLPGGTHPDCALQLTHAAGLLRKPFGRDIKNQIVPLQTNFLNGN